jgi:hypothetical protein
MLGIGASGLVGNSNLFFRISKAHYVSRHQNGFLP